MTKKEAAEVHKLIRPLRGYLKTLLRELVKTSSVNLPPGGNETPAQRLLNTFLRTHGVKSVLYNTEFIESAGNPLVRKNRQYKGRKNLSARLSGTGRGKSLLLSGHMDTVPPGRMPWAGWSRSPWSGEFSAGRVHGLGSFDDEARIAAFLELPPAGAR